jgi:Eisosome component PIL1
MRRRILPRLHQAQSPVVSSVAAASVSRTASHRIVQRSPTSSSLSLSSLEINIFSLVLIGGLGHALRRNTAGAFGPDLAKKLTQLVKMEKNVMRSLEMVAKERMEVAVGISDGSERPGKLTGFQQQLSLWGEHGDEDVSDVTDKLGVLLYEIGELEDQYVDRYDQYRITMKSIRNIEASVQPSRDRTIPHTILQYTLR